MARAQSALAGYPGAQSAGSINPGFFLEGIRHSDLGMIRANAQPTPAASTKTIRNDVNLKKTTLRLVSDESEPRRFHVEFSFDTNVECLVSVHYAAVEAAGPAGAPRFSPLRGPAKPHKEKRPKGVGQTFRTRPEHALDTTRYSPADLQYDAGAKRYPLVVHLEVAPSAAPTASVSSQTTFADLVWEGPALVARPLKQKIQVGKLAYEMQEIYGIEGGAKPTAQPAASDADADPVDDADAILENGRECVVCMTEERDTAVLPCRHMCASPRAAPRRARARAQRLRTRRCMCSECAKVLRLQSNRCPICRTVITSLLRIHVDRDASTSDAHAKEALGKEKVRADKAEARADKAEDLAAPDAAPSDGGEPRPVVR